jgi:heme-degrading monooxygenase HmoA
MEGTNMVYVVLDYKVEDYAKWKPAFDNYGAARNKAGSKGGKLFQYLDDKNHVCMLFEWDSKENATKFFASDETKKTQKGAGVVGTPMVVYLDKIEDFKA